jgi:hypothetical protein
MCTERKIVNLSCETHLIETGYQLYVDENVSIIRSAPWSSHLTYLAMFEDLFQTRDSMIGNANGPGFAFGQ